MTERKKCPGCGRVHRCKTTKCGKCRHDDQREVGGTKKPYGENLIRHLSVGFREDEVEWLKGKAATLPEAVRTVLRECSENPPPVVSTTQVRIKIEEDLREWLIRQMAVWDSTASDVVRSCVRGLMERQPGHSLPWHACLLHVGGKLEILGSFPTFRQAMERARQPVPKGTRRPFVAHEEMLDNVVPLS